MKLTLFQVVPMNLCFVLVFVGFCCFHVLLSHEMLILMSVDKRKIVP